MNIAAPNLDCFPADLKQELRWVTWRSVKRGNRTTKPPDQAVNDETAWLSFAQAIKRVSGGKAHGVGFVLGSGIVGIDLDDCIDEDGTLHEVARDAFALCTYCERSPSGRGLHFLVRGKIKESRNVRKRAGVPAREIYDGREGPARYLTVTGDRVGATARIAEGPQAQAALDAFVAKWFPSEEQDRGEGDVDAAALTDDAVLAAMFSAKDGPRWRAIFGGDDSRYASQSEADLALCGKLRFYTRGNAGQMDRLFRRSGLMRAKWDAPCRDGQTYGEVTLSKAIAKGGPYYAARPRDEKPGRARERTAWARFPLWWAIRLAGSGELAFRALIAIASYADPDGESFPSVATIAAHCRVSERRVKAALATLKAAGIVTSTQRPRQSNLYRLALAVPEGITPHAEERRASRVLVSGHLGCPRHGTVSDQELTISIHRERRRESAA